MPAASSDDIAQQIDDCEARESRLSDWERGFIASIKERTEQGVALTRKQVEQLDVIWERVTTKGRP